MYTIKSNTKDSNRFFSEDRKSGILIQHKLNRAIYYVDNETIDEFPFHADTTMKEIDKWIDAKQKHYNESKVTV